MFFFLQMAALSFEHILDCLQSLEFLPKDMMTSYKALHFRDIRFMLLQCSLNMQLVSLTYLMSLVNDNSFQPKGIKADLYSSSTAILLVFLSDEEHQAIQYVHIGLVVLHAGCNLYTQDGILPFMKSIEEDLAKTRERCACNKDVGGVSSHALLVANYGGTMAVPTDPLYCLMYPTVYNAGTENQTHFNTAASPSGIHTHVCMCHSLLQLADKDPKNRRTFEGSCLIVPHGTQYWSLFPEITTPCNHWGPLIDPNTGEPYPMAVVGDFCLKDIIFPGSLRDSLLFNEDDLTRLKRKGFCISTYREEKSSPTTSKEDKHQCPCIQENVQSSSSKEEKSHRTNSFSRASSPWVPDSTSGKKSSCQTKHVPQAKEQLEKCDTKDKSTSSKHKDRSCSDKKSRRGSDKESSSTTHKCALSPPP